jgi:hypothetical protein
MFALRDKLQFRAKPANQALTFRQMVNIYQKPHPWVDLGIDLLMGLPADKKANTLQYMFLPDFLMQGFAPARIEEKVKPAALNAADAPRPLVKEVHAVYKATAPPATATSFTPTLFFWILFIVVAAITVIQVRKPAPSRHVLDVVLFSLTGLLGIILTFLWFGTDHKTFADNLNIVWAFPLHLPLALVLLRRTKPGFVKNYFLVFAILLGLLAIGWKIVPQEFHPAVLPIILMLALRAGYIFSTKSSFKRATNPYR